MDIRFFTLMIFLTVCSSCSVQPKKNQWNNDFSEAKNISQAAGIDGLKDQVLAAEYGNPNGVGNAIEVGNIMSGYASPPPGFTSLSSVGVGLLGLLISPDTRAARNSFFYWDKESKNKTEFYKNFIEMMESAKTDYKNNNGTFKLKSRYSVEERTPLPLVTLKPYWAIRLSGPGCTTKKTEWGCGIGFNLAEIRNSYPPNGDKAVMHTDVSNSYSFTSFKICLINEENRKFECSWVSRGKVNQGFDELKFMTEFSSYLPEDFYIYAAPNRLFTGREKKIKAPILISQGVKHYFLIAERL